jgi:hypothetical protein
MSPIAISSSASDDGSVSDAHVIVLPSQVRTASDHLLLADVGALDHVPVIVDER